jgi:hypothetical protein
LADVLRRSLEVADAFRPFIVGFSAITILNVCSHREQSYRQQHQHDRDGREAAMTGH